MALRCALYAGYASDRQRAASIEDRFRVCRERAEREGRKIVSACRDAAVSGDSVIFRPGVQALLEDARRGAFEIVVAAALDRNEAADAIRGSIERIVLTPGAKRGQTDAAPHGDLGTILEWAGSGRGKEGNDRHSQIGNVDLGGSAGAGSRGKAVPVRGDPGEARRACQEGSTGVSAPPFPPVVAGP